MLVSIFLMLAAASMVLKDSQYEKILVWSAEYFLDSQLIVGSQLDIDIARNLSFRANNIQLIANDDSYQFSVKKLNINFKFDSYLSTGAFLFNDISLEGVKLVIKEKISEDFQSIDDLEIPPVILSNVSVKDFVLSYQEISPGTLHVFSLEEIMLGKTSEYQATSVKVIGELNKEPFLLQGTLGSIRSVQDISKPLPVDFQFSSANINAKLKGMVDDPLRGKGLNINVKGTVNNVGRFAEIFLDGVPKLGDLQLDFTVNGDYSSPSADIIDAKLMRGQQLSLITKGSIDDVVNGKGFNLTLEAKSNDAELLSWLLLNKTDQLQSMQLKTRLLGDVGNFTLRSLQASAETVNHFKAQLDGDVNHWRAKRKLNDKDAKLKVQFSAPSLSAIPMINLGDIPKLKGVTGSAMVGFSKNEIGIYDTLIEAGKKGENQLRLVGYIGRINLKENLDVSGLSLKTNIELINLAELNALVDYEFPTIGPVKLYGDLISQDSKLHLKSMQIDMGSNSGAMLSAKGEASVSLNNFTLYEITADTKIKTNQVSELATQLGFSLPALGQAQFSGKIESVNTDLKISDAVLVIGDKLQPSVHISSDFIEISSGNNRIGLNFEAEVSKIVEQVSDLLPGELGQVKGEVLFSEINNTWKVDKFDIKSSNTSLYELNIGGENIDLESYDSAQINSSFKVAQLDNFTRTLGLDWYSPSNFETSGLLSFGNAKLIYKGETQLGSSKSVMEINGYLDNDYPVFEATIKIPVFDVEDFIFIQFDDQIQSSNIEKKSTDTYFFSREQFNIDFLNTFDLDLSLSIDKIINAGVVLDSVDSHLKLRKGLLVVESERIMFEGGNSQFLLEVQIADIPKYKLRVTTRDAALGPLMAKLQRKIPIRGYTNSLIRIDSKGRSPHELASNISGEIHIGIENIQIPYEIVEALTADVFGWVLSRSNTNKYVNLNCALVSFNAENGKLESDVILSDGPRISLKGKAEFDLDNETMNVVLLPKKKRRLFTSVTPIKIYGPILNPTISAIPAKAAAQEIGMIAAFAPIVLPVRVVSKLISMIGDDGEIGDGCSNFEEISEELNIVLDEPLKH